MPFYETVLIARQELGASQVDELTAKCRSIIESGDGKILKTENWGLRTLAYKIRKNRKGHYVLIEADAPAPAILEMERNLRLNEDVLRYMTIRLEEPSQGPSPIIDKSGRDDDNESGKPEKFEKSDKEAA